jgi:hypothetical protein
MSPAHASQLPIALARVAAARPPLKGSGVKGVCWPPVAIDSDYTVNISVLTEVKYLAISGKLFGEEFALNPTSFVGARLNKRQQNPESATACDENSPTHCLTPKQHIPWGIIALVSTMSQFRFGGSAPAY